MGDTIKVGDRIELTKYTLSKDKSEKGKVYLSQLLDLNKDGTVNIAMPIEGGHVVPLPINMRCELCIFTASGLYQCRAVITKRYRIDKLFVLTVKFLSDLEKYQRRQYFRLPCVIDLFYHLITEEEERTAMALIEQKYTNEDEKRGLQLKLAEFARIKLPGIANNISGGGLRFSSEEQLEKGRSLNIDIGLSNMGKIVPLELKARVISSGRTVNQNMIFEHRVEFIGINKETREFIVRYVFNEERRQRKKEKGWS